MKVSAQKWCSSTVAGEICGRAMPPKRLNTDKGDVSLPRMTNFVGGLE